MSHRPSLNIDIPSFNIPLAFNAPLIVALTVLVLILCAPNRYIGTRNRPELPGPRGWPLIGNSIDILLNRKRMLMRFRELEASYGELLSVTLPLWGRIITINHPRWLEHTRKGDTVRYGKGDATLAVFAQFPGKKSPFGSEGAEWRWARKAAQPIFTVASFNCHVSRAMGVTIPCVHSLLSSASKQSVQVDFNNLSGRIVLQIFCQMAFGMEVDILKDDLASISEKTPLVDSTLIMNNISSGRLFNPFWRFTDKLDGTERRFKQSQKEFNEAISDLVAQRKHELEIGAAAKHDDFLSTLLSEAEDKDPLLIRDTLITLLFASRDNTQNSFTWALYELFNHPAWIEKMRAEAVTQAPRDGGIVSYAEIHSYPIHMAVLYETLRLWPGVPKNARVALEDDILPAVPEAGLPEVKIHRGEYIMWSDWSMGRNPKVWGEDATEFNPGRFLTDEGLFQKPPVPKFHSFGFGPRSCPGAQLAAYEFVALFSSILPHFDLSPVEKRPRTMIDGFTTTMEGPLMVNVQAFDQ